MRQLLLVGGLGLGEHDLGVEPETRAESRHRIDVEVGFAVIVVRRDLRTGGVAKAAEQQLAAYVAARGQQTGQRYVGVLTDGAEWRLYGRIDGDLQQVTALTVDPSSGPSVDELVPWLEAVLATSQQLTPSPREIVRRLGAGSSAYALDVAELAAIYAKYRELPTVRVKRGLWAKLLTTALGTNFANEDSLFVDHTLLVAMAEVIGHAVVGFRPEDSMISGAMIMRGARFSDAQIGGVVEADFFDWVVEVPGGEQFVKGLARRLSRFAWEHVEHDVMKVLYESIISPETRHRLGEYYTPSWLAEEIVADRVDDPLAQRVLDASCGSGTFLFHAVRSYLAAAEAAGRSGPDAIRGAVAHVIGIDVHPVAVTLARVTYLLAIGKGRLRADDRPAFAVPVYLGDSLRWGQETTLLSYKGLSIPTADDYQMFVNQPDFTDQTEFTDQLKFPERVVADASQFDRLVAELADQAVKPERRTPAPSLAMTFERFKVHADDRPVLQQTFAAMCELHDRGQDHIWGYYVRNLARPVWLARAENRVDRLVGNPPWLAYRYMTVPQQASFRAMSIERGLWAGGTVATNQDLSALFVARCIELYLRPGGRFGFVMPWAVLSRRQYAGFRTGHFPVRAQPVNVAFDRPWDLHKVKPSFFPLPASVVFGRRGDESAAVRALSQVPEVWSGRFETAVASRAEAVPSIHKMDGEPPPPRAEQGSRYAARFSQGATVVPRFLFFVEPGATNPLGLGAGRRAVQSRRSANEKKPWKNLASLHGIIERQFILPVHLGDSILPFRCLPPRQAVIPWDGERLLHGENEQLDLYPGLARWWRSAEAIWRENRSSERLSLVGRLDYRRGVSQQFPATDHRVVYTKSGMYLAAAVVSDRAAVIDHKLYWAAVGSLDEASFLTAILNSTTLTMAVRPLQARGEHNPRDFDKYIFQLPIPLYDPSNADHQSLAALASRSEQVAAGVDLPAVRFEALRRRIREALVEDGVAADIDAIVKTLLAS
ncbi:MAG: N-6 DNA methylase [Egibacteraceae bacterium]